MVLLDPTYTVVNSSLVLVGAALAAIVRVQARSYRFKAVMRLIIETRIN